MKYFIECLRTLGIMCIAFAAIDHVCTAATDPRYDDEAERAG